MDDSLNRRFDTPVLFLVFNRPDTTGRVLEAIRAARPPRLYIASDGPRTNRAGEAEKVKQVREIVSRINWPCAVKTLFRAENLGCKMAVSGAISWFFEHEEQGIVLEDDCLPHPDFFGFCQALLDQYEGDDRVAMITGDNFQKGQRRGDNSYYFSKYSHIWGWASWRRAWAYYDRDLLKWPEFKCSAQWMETMPDPVERKYWASILDRTHAGEIDTWDYSWTASIWYMGSLVATPNVNLVSNIGFGAEATHTAASSSEQAAIPVKPLGRLSHPPRIEQSEDADRFVFSQVMGGRNLRFPRSFIWKARRLAGKIYRRNK